MEDGTNVSPDVSFLTEMMKHHEMAISMSKNILENGSDIQVKNLANSIIINQSNELNLMKMILKSISIKPVQNDKMMIESIKIFTNSLK